MSEAIGPWRRWTLAARVRTLPAAIVPVAVGAVAVHPAGMNWINTLLCVGVALALQVGTNYANDYSDGIRGSDDERVGPFRLTASRLVAPTTVRRAAATCFALAGAIGLLLASRTSWWLVLVGATAILAGWFYTGGPKPYGYFGLGELFVFVYFGLVATVGTAFVQHETIPVRAWWLGVATGAMACALLEANNLRDIDGDRDSNKRTLAARMGREKASSLYAMCVVGLVVGLLIAGQSIAAGVGLLIYLPALRLSYSGRTGRDLLPLLKYSARAQLIVGAFVTLVVARS